MTKIFLPTGRDDFWDGIFGMGWDGIDFGRSQMGLGSDSDFHPNPEWDWDYCRGINPKSGSRKIPNIFYDHF